MTRGIPLPDASADAVYHSYFLPTLRRNLKDPSRDEALRLLRECRRALKPAGVLRVVVPDFEAHCRRYLDCVEAGLGTSDEALERLLGHYLLGEAEGSRRQRPLLRRLENLLLGGARDRGQAHWWDYDRLNLRRLLEAAGFSRIEERGWDVSAIPGWSEIALDSGPDGRELRSPSLYLEAAP